MIGWWVIMLGNSPVKIFSWFEQALFPVMCTKCGQEGELLCRACAAHWFFAPVRIDDRLAIFSYADPVARGLVQAWKYGFAQEAWQILKDKVDEYLPHMQMWAAQSGATAIVPVPLFYVRRNERGFDQAVAIADFFASRVNLPVAHSLRRHTPTSPHAQVAHAERLQRFSTNPFKALGDLSGQKLILVDDVYTSGATVGAARRAVEDAGGQVVGIFVLCESNENA